MATRLSTPPIKTPPRVSVGQRLAATVAVVAAYRLLHQLPLPGLDPGATGEAIAASSGLLTLDRFSVMALGITPWFNALLLSELVLFLVPSLAGRMAGSERAAANWVYGVMGLTLAFALLQAGGIGRAMEAFDGLVIEPGSAFRLTAGATLTAGALLAVWLATVINTHGTGNGLWVLLLAPLVIGLPSRLAQLVYHLQTGGLSTAAFVAALAVLAVAVAAVARLLLVREREGSTRGLDAIVWPGLIGAAAAAWMTACLLYVEGANLDAAADALLSPQGPAALLLTATLTAAFALLYGRRHAGSGQPLAAALTLGACSVLPEIASTGLGIPVIVDGRMLIVLTAVAFAVVRLRETAARGKTVT